MYRTTDDNTGVSLELFGSTDKNGWVVINGEKISLHEFRFALATVHEYIEDSTTKFCSTCIPYENIQLGIFVYDWVHQTNVVIEYQKPRNDTLKTLKSVTRNLSTFLSIAKFVLDELS